MLVGVDVAIIRVLVAVVSGWINLAPVLPAPGCVPATFVGSRGGRMSRGARRRSQVPCVMTIGRICRFRRGPFVVEVSGRLPDHDGPGAGSGGRSMTDARVIHFEIVGKDGAALQRYYADLFGWSLDTSHPGGYGMTEPSATGPVVGIGSTPGRLVRARHGVRHGGGHRRHAGSGRVARRERDHAQVQPGRERAAGAGGRSRGARPGHHADVVGARPGGRSGSAPALPRLGADYPNVMTIGRIFRRGGGVDMRPIVISEEPDFPAGGARTGGAAGPGRQRNATGGCAAGDRP